MKLQYFAFLALVLGALGCEGQPEGPEPLVSVHGSAQLADALEPADLQAAIVFLSIDKNTLHILDPETEAEFPERFQLELWDEPPEDSFANLVGPDGQANTLALGYFAAVTADHPEFAPRIGQRSESNRRICDPDDPDQCWCAEEGCERTVSLCLEASSQCVKQTFLCPEVDSPTESCMLLDSEGDPEIARQPWVSVPGISQNYMILYAKRPIAAHSSLADVLGSKQDLPAGYHLIEARDRTEQEQKDADACRERAEKRAAIYYNQENGTDFDVEYLKLATCPVPGFCRSDVFAQFLAAAMFELKCPMNERVMTPVPTRPAAPIRVDLQPKLWAPMPLPFSIL